jgi:hypothetical protein
MAACGNTFTVLASIQTRPESRVELKVAVTPSRRVSVSASLRGVDAGTVLMTEYHRRLMQTKLASAT